jgi:hypothetical protein
MTNTETARPNIWMTALGAGAITAVANLIVYFIAIALNVSLQVAAPGSTELQRLPFFPVILASVIPALAAAAVLLLLRCFTPRANTIFQTIAAIIVIVSFGGPLGQPTDDATKFVLNLMHVIAGVIITLGLTRSSNA